LHLVGVPYYFTYKFCVLCFVMLAARFVCFRAFCDLPLRS
jgi:hypothetical protein